MPSTSESKVATAGSAGVTSGKAAEVLAAAERLLTAFAAGNTEEYFACFDPEATFIFHSLPGRISSTAEYRTLWAQWVRELDLRVLGCSSSDQTVDFISDDAALFTHSVEVSVQTRMGKEQRHERESIVFVRRPGGAWFALHEHLSRAPSP